MAAATKKLKRPLLAATETWPHANGYSWKLETHSND